jgi:cell division septum initiation protein DivIVA
VNEKHTLNELLDAWETSLQPVEAAVANDRWRAVRSRLRENRACFDRLRACIENAAADAQADRLTHEQKQRLQNGVDNLNRLIEAYQRNATDLQQKIRRRRLARQTAHAYGAAAPKRPQHVRLLAGRTQPAAGNEPPADPHRT